jgi:enoyl-CoA hydratase
MENLMYEKRGYVGILTVNRPDALNALNIDVLNEMLMFLHSVPKRDELKALVLTGAGEKAFIAGADVKTMLSMDHFQMLEFCSLGQTVSKALETAPCTTIAAVFGYTLGGGLEMALACDFIYAAQSAKMGLPEINLAIIPGFGGTQRLSRVVGTRFAKEMILTGKTLSASEAYEIGLVNRICNDEELLKNALETAEQIAKHSLFAISQAKQAINSGYSLAMSEALELEKNLCALCFSTPECLVALSGFVNRHKQTHKV